MPKKDLQGYLKDNKFTVSSDEVNCFKANLQEYLNNINMAIQKNETEEHLKGILIKFLSESLYSDNKYSINTQSSIDAAICKDNKLQVLIETKKPSNTLEMVTDTNLNKKALWEIVLYYIEATRSIQDGKVKRIHDSEIKNLIITDCKRFFIFDSQNIEFIVKGELEKFWEKKETSQLISRNKDIFYDKAKEFFGIEENVLKLDYVSFDIEEFFKTRTGIISSYKMLSKQILLKDNAKKIVATPLNAAFYQELLYILGLKEVKENGKTIIKINFDVENTFAVQVYKYLKDDKGILDENEVIDKTFSAIIVWTNRLLFIKLFEGQLFAINGKKQEYRILDKDKIQSENDLQNLFFRILGTKDRENGEFFDKFKDVPYLNSSLFENYDVEKNDVMIRDIDNKDVQVKPHSKTKKQGELKLVEYIIDFLNSYTFSSISVGESETTSSKEIIDATVLGLIFEKINGYKDGSYYTPSSITEYICKETIESSILQKVNESYKQDLKTFDDLILFASDISKKRQINDIINSLRICDPAVGSGHFLVSALNRIIAIKSELGVLFYYNENRLLTDYEIRVVNDVLTITDGNGELFTYNRTSAGSLKVQKTIFCEKRLIIENCLFGVDINDKAVSICQLRLWIELLKNAYYENNVMETLPNIDINIKCGNSLVHKLPVEVGKKLSGKTDKELKKLIIEYKQSVNIYKHESNKVNKQKIKIAIDKMKKVLHQSAVQMSMDFMGDTTDYAEMDLMNNAFEWAIEFPEVLSDDGTFLGFDCVIGNPPYIDSETMTKTMPNLRELYSKKYLSAKGNWDLFIPFWEKTLTLLSKQGFSAFITPNKWLSIKYGETLRNLLFDYIYCVSDYSNLNVFSSANVSAVVVFINKQKSKNITVVKHDADYSERKHFVVEKEKISNLNNLGVCLSERFETLSKLFVYKRLGCDYNVIGAATVAEAYEIAKIIEDEKIPNEEKLKFINTGTIDKFTSLWGKEELTYIKNKYLCPTVSKIKLKNILPKRYAQAITPKLITTGIRYLEVFADLQGEYLAAKSTEIITTKNGASIKALLPILNSNVAYFFIKEAYGGMAMGGGITFSLDNLSKIPIPTLDDNTTKLLEKLADKYLDSFDINSQNELDMIISKLYGFNEEDYLILEQFKTETKRKR